MSSLGRAKKTYFNGEWCHGEKWEVRDWSVLYRSYALIFSVASVVKAFSHYWKPAEFIADKEDSKLRLVACQYLPANLEDAEVIEGHYLRDILINVQF